LAIGVVPVGFLFVRAIGARSAPHFVSMISFLSRIEGEHFHLVNSSV
jgi:hypothetical protein